MKKTTTSILFLLSVTFLLPSCGAIIKSYVKKNAYVPPDFGKDKTIILVPMWKKKYNKKLQQDFQKYYKGDYLLVSKDELETTYKDISKYRYIFDNTLHVTKLKDAVTGAGAGAMGSLTFHLTDRVENKSYDTEVSSGASWNAVAKAYIQKLEQGREKNTK